MKLNKKQKRTATIASMAALLAVVLGMGGQTFAKYIETNTAEATQATIAKWGVVIKNTVEAGTETFKSDYDGKVVSEDSRPVVAPGTTGTYGLLVTGVPEVKTKVTVDLTIQDIYVTVAGKTYYPIVWTFNGTEYNGATAASTIEGLVDEVYNYNANQNLNVVDFTLTWTWAFDNSADDSKTGYNEFANGYDTIFGDLASGVTGSVFDDPSTVAVEKDQAAGGVTTLIVGVTATVEQVQ